MFKILFVLLSVLPLGLLPSAAQQNMTQEQMAAYALRAQSQGSTPSQIRSELMGGTDDLRQSVAQEPRTRMRTVAEDSLRNEDMPLYEEPAADSIEIFGHNIFNARNLTFEPNLNIATPPDYRLGPGDEVIVDVWGGSQSSLREVISPDGNIFVSGIGPVSLNGMTVKEADKVIKNRFSRIYSGLDDERSHVQLTLGRVRTMQINVMGEVSSPGTYAVSAFASVFHALYMSGGVNGIGSLRNVNVVRAGKVVASVDMYDFIMNGSVSGFFKLSDDDVVIVPAYDRLVNITGNVKRPMYYEMKEGESLQTLIDYAGGFRGDAYRGNVTVVRYNDTRREVHSVDEGGRPAFVLADGDSVGVGAVLDRYLNRVEVKGAVMRPGIFRLDDKVNSVRTLIEGADGLSGDAFLNRALIHREKEDLSREIIPLDLGAVMDGTGIDVALRNNDVLEIKSINDLREVRMVSVYGSVGTPGDYPYEDNCTLEDVVLMAGGLLESASEVQIEVARRIRDPRSRTEILDISDIFSLDISSGLALGDAGRFVLEPFDEIYVRSSPVYKRQENVSVVGEIMFEGHYSMVSKKECLSDLIRQAGGFTSFAYVKGARLERRINTTDRNKNEIMKRTAERSSGRDSLSLDVLEMDEDVYTVGIELDKAMENPGSAYDMVLRPGDRLIIPTYVNTVAVNGEVLYPNTVSYMPGRNMKYYINQGGGYTVNAKKSKVYVLYMNGTLSRYKNKNSIQPGCEILVPSRKQREPMSAGEIMGIGSTAASIGTMGAAITNLIK